MLNAGQTPEEAEEEKTLREIVAVLNQTRPKILQEIQMLEHHLRNLDTTVQRFTLRADVLREKGKL